MTQKMRLNISGLIQFEFGIIKHSQASDWSDFTLSPKLTNQSSEKSLSSNNTKLYQYGPF